MDSGNRLVNGDVPGNVLSECVNDIAIENEGNAFACALRRDTANEIGQPRGLF